MINIEDKSKCCGCHACFNICPKNAIEMIQDEKGFYYPKVLKEKCVNCGLCNKVCPILARVEITNSPKAFAVYSKDEEIRKQSSSGGVFSLIAEKILEQNGVVFGAQFDEKFKVIHTYIEKKEDLEQLRGSKYVQSQINDTYKKAEEFLKQDRFVLFTGTPCQIEGLKQYLRKDYEKLYTQDLICHGVPSPIVWEKYLEYRNKMDKEVPNKISFRNKDNGWKIFNMKFEYHNKTYKENQHKDIFMQAFLKNVSLRDSCYNCSFKKKNRVSDITLADFWGIQNILPEMDDDKGTSLVIVNSEKGNEIFENIKEKVIFQEVDFETAIKYNKSMTESVKENGKREKFFEKLDKVEFNKLVKKYTNTQSFAKKILRKCKQILKK